VPHPAASRCSSVTHGIGSNVTDIPQLSNAFNMVDYHQNARFRVAEFLSQRTDVIVCYWSNAVSLERCRQFRGMNGADVHGAQQNDLSAHNRKLVKWPEERQKTNFTGFLHRRFETARTTTIGVANHVTLGHVPARLPASFFPVYFRAAQSLTATLCGCLSKRICILRQQLR